VIVRSRRVCVGRRGDGVRRGRSSLVEGVIGTSESGTSSLGESLVFSLFRMY
jgi:hypothetical protein